MMQHINSDSTVFNDKNDIGFWRNLIFLLRNRGAWGGSQSARHLSCWRRLLFLIAALGNHQQMATLWEFFGKNPLRRSILAAHTSIWEQVTRNWLYHNSTIKDRAAIAQEHFQALQSKLSEGALSKIYLKEGITLWSQEYQKDTLSLKLYYDRFYRKEGLMAVALHLGGMRIYSASFWLARNPQGEISLWVGALQGSRGENDAIRGLTKHFFGYRPKNLMIYAVRNIANQLTIKRIYAVSNHGSYVNHRLHFNRRLMTSLDDFWKETGGDICADLRFFELPCHEVRKDIQEVESHKRNLYRKRFAALDAIEAAIAQALEPYLLKA